jgi:predicted  nucleic acid-binding Zn-ribbon protein
VNRPEALWTLQQLDTRAERLREDAAPLRRALEGDPEAPDPRPALTILLAEREALKGRLRAAEREEETQRARAVAHERQLMGGTIHNPKELSKLSQELDHMRSRMAVQVDGLLEILEAQEALEAGIRAAEKQAALDRATLAGIERELEDLASERAAVWSDLSEAAQRLYAKVSALRKPAVVAIQGGACGGCRIPVAPARLKLARGEEPITCEVCTRILYLA